jgi:hypothetical protein
MAILGYNTLGTASSSSIEDFITGSAFTIPENGMADSISVGLKSNVSWSNKVKCAIYRVSDKVLIGVTEEKIVTLSSTANWFTFLFTGDKPELAKNIEYYLVAWAIPSSFTNLIVANANIATSFALNRTYNSFPNPINITDTFPLVYSIYCTYTPLAVQYTLTIQVEGEGTTEPVVGVYEYDENEEVPITTYPTETWELDYWTLDTVDVGCANPYTVLMDYDHTLVAVFTQLPPSLTVATEEATDITWVSASLNSNIERHVYMCTKHGFEWRKVGEESWVEWTEEGEFPSDDYAHGIIGLIKNTLYEFRAKAYSIETGWVYGEILEFATLEFDLYEYNHLQDSLIEIDGSVWGAQTFTPLVSHYLKKVALWIDSWTIEPPLEGYFYVSIRNTDADGKPTGEDLIVKGILADSLPKEYYNNARVEIEFDTSLFVEVGIKYAIVFQYSDSDSGNGTDIYFKSSNVYSRGTYCVSEDSGVTWALNINKDFWFEEWGDTEETYTKTYSTDILFKKLGIEILSYIDVMFEKLGIEKTDSVDIFLQKLGIPKTNSIDTFFKKLDIVNTDSIDALLKKLGVTATDSTDVILKKFWIHRNYDMDTVLSKLGITRTDSIDVLLEKLDITKTASISIDVLLKKLTPIRYKWGKSGGTQFQVLKRFITRGISKYKAFIQLWGRVFKASGDIAYQRTIILPANANLGVEVTSKILMLHGIIGFNRIQIMTFYASGDIGSIVKEVMFALGNVAYFAKRKPLVLNGNIRTMKELTDLVDSI